MGVEWANIFLEYTVQSSLGLQVLVWRATEKKHPILCEKNKYLFVKPLGF